MLVHLVRDLSGPGTSSGLMLLDTVYRDSASGVQVMRHYRSLEREECTALYIVDCIYTALCRELARSWRRYLSLATGCSTYSKLLAWLLQEHLYDRKGEFFIVREESMLVGEGEGELSRSKCRMGIF